jgi:hypothetical protein
VYTGFVLDTINIKRPAFAAEAAIRRSGGQDRKADKKVTGWRQEIVQTPDPLVS